MILVTGGSGLVGGALIKQLLAEGKPVRALVNHTQLTQKNEPLLATVKGNILDVVALEEAFNGVTEVYHCAASVSFNPRRREELFKINVEGTANVVNMALDAGIRKMIYVSSVAALGRIRKGETIDETAQWTPETSNSAYGKSKYQGEMEVWRGIGEGLNAAIVNPSLIIGEADWNKSSMRIFKNVYDGFPWYSEGVTGWVDVQDVVRAMRMLMDSNISEQKFIVSGENCSYHEVLNMIADGFGKKRPHRKVTALIASLVWRLEAIKSKFTGKEPLLTKETVDTARSAVYYNHDKILQALPGFS
ncbi:MAG: NAD-dependent epimerase/dehydratase family protein, partial [Dinghuibacter sp.]|nr:NAD-dependent epimerase/dehydratase family protein [Dinghuibacter sp.]